jgi:5'-3' exonuclease
MENVMNQENKFDFVIIDCSNLAYRSWWNNRFRKTSKDIFCGLEYGFIQAIMVIVRSWYPARLVLVWDGEPTRGLSIFPRITDETTGKIYGYKAGRKNPEDKENEPDWGVRLGNLRDKFRTLVHSLYHKNNEADEQIAFFTRKAESFGLTSLIISNDEDLHQLVSDYTYILRLARNKGEEDAIWGEKEIQGFWGVEPKRLPLRWAIEGDGGPVKGIPRIPKSIILDLINCCNSLESLFQVIDEGSVFQTALQKEKFTSGKDIIERNYKLFNLYSVDDNLSVLEGTIGNSSNIKKLCSILEMGHFVDRKEWNLLEESGKTPLFTHQE